MKTKSKIKKKFKQFFEKHPTVKKIPYLVTVVIPKYESKGERVLWEFNELMEDEDNFNKYVESTYTNVDDFYEAVFEDIPEISEKDAFYIFDENNLVLIYNELNDVRIEIKDYSDEIIDRY